MKLSSKASITKLEDPCLFGIQSIAAQTAAFTQAPRRFALFDLLCGLIKMLPDNIFKERIPIQETSHPPIASLKSPRL